MVQNSHQWRVSFLQMGTFIKPHALGHHNRMVEWRGSTAIFLMLQEPLCFKESYIPNSRDSMYWLLLISLTWYLVWFIKENHRKESILVLCHGMMRLKSCNVLLMHITREGMGTSLPLVVVAASFWDIHTLKRVGYYLISIQMRFLCFGRYIFWKSVSRITFTSLS